MRHSVVLFLFVAACGGKSSGDTAAPAAPCDTVAASIVVIDTTPTNGDGQ